MTKANKRWLGLISIILVLASISYFFIQRQHTQHPIAHIYLDQTLIESIDLTKVKEPYQRKIFTSETDYNVIQVSPGKIEIIDANCPDKLCVKQGAISDGAEPLICLPHKLMITIDGAKIAFHQDNKTNVPDAVTK